MRHLGAILALISAPPLAAACLFGGSDGQRSTAAPTRVTVTPAALDFATPRAAGPRSTPALRFLPPETAPSSPGSYLLEVPSGRTARVSDLAGGVWSPDGTAIAFPSCCNGSPGFIDILDLQTGATAHIPTGDARDLAWAPDSIHLAYVAMDRYLAALGVYVVDRDGYNPHAVVKDAGAGEPRWVDDRTIAYSKGNQGDVPTFFTVDISRPGTAKRLSTKDPPDAGDPRIIFGFPSSDGVWVVYYEGTYHSDHGQTLAWNSRTGELQVLLQTLALGEFAPGSHTVRLFLPDPAKTGLSLNQIVDLDTGKTISIVAGVESHWTADGKWLVYETAPCAGDGAPSGLNSVRIDNGDRVSLVPAGEGAYGFAVSSAGSSVAITSATQRGTPRFVLRIVPADGSPGFSAPLGLDPHVGPGSWSPDGRLLLFTLGMGGGAC
jgi:Tol biopolymer transport system component